MLSISPGGFHSHPMLSVDTVCAYAFLVRAMDEEEDESEVPPSKGKSKKYSAKSQGLQRVY